MIVNNKRFLRGILIGVVANLCFIFMPIIAESATSVPLVKLLTSPEEFADAEITTAGVLGKDFSGRFCLYLNAGSAENLVTMNGILISFLQSDGKPSIREELERVLGKHVLLGGTFKPGFTLPQIYVGVLRDVSYIVEYPLSKGN